MNGREQLDFIYRLSFNRFGGTENELRAAELILSEIEKLGGKAELEEFKILAVKDNKQSILSLSKRFLVEKYISLNKCAKSVREALKKAKTEHYHGKVILRRHSGDEEIVKEF